MAAESELEIHQIRYFVETAKTGSMSQAAKNLYVSQQALSKGVANLEEALGAELFVRTKSGVSLTAFGQFFLARAKLVLSSVEFAGNSLRDFSTGTRRTIALGMPSECTTDFGGTLSPTKLYALQQTSPNVTFEFVELRIAEIQKRLDNGTLQFGISGEYDEKRYDNVLLDVFPMTVLVSKNNPLANKPYVSLADLAGGTPRNTRRRRGPDPAARTPRSGKQRRAQDAAHARQPCRRRGAHRGRRRLCNPSRAARVQDHLARLRRTGTAGRP